jgi:hypothetical protein
MRWIAPMMLFSRIPWRGCGSAAARDPSSHPGRTTPAAGRRACDFPSSQSGHQLISRLACASGSRWSPRPAEHAVAVGGRELAPRAAVRKRHAAAGLSRREAVSGLHPPHQRRRPARPPSSDSSSGGRRARPARARTLADRSPGGRARRALPCPAGTEDPHRVVQLGQAPIVSRMGAAGRSPSGARRRGVGDGEVIPEASEARAGTPGAWRGVSEDHGAGRPGSSSNPPPARPRPVRHSASTGRPHGKQQLPSQDQGPPVVYARAFHASSRFAPPRPRRRDATSARAKAFAADTANGNPDHR